MTNEYAYKSLNLEHNLFSETKVFFSSTPFETFFNFHVSLFTMFSTES